MVLREERQREISSNFSSSLQNAALQVRGFQTGKENGVRTEWKKRTMQEKRGQICAHCGKSGHLKESCFEIVGYPDWYKAFADQKKRTGGGSIKILSAVDSHTPGSESVQSVMDEQTVAELIRGELKRFMRCRTRHIQQKRTDNFEDFSDGSKQHVDTVGNVQLSNTILLTSVLHDHRTSQTVGIGRLLGKLYILDESSFKTDTINDSLHTLQEQSLTVDTLDVNLA
ncbi:UNVERIFIED_CONTAM: hypothetical protein Sradi_1592000 [Sesamum radiatum]|uniref:CCHC-type domain-containing protein n=1 Tax=Sesamum radiatum TaxID=300843 RepID=A0AAW2UAR7_SESRA